jgi:mono/diheme cytochrome c family protein
VASRASQILYVCNRFENTIGVWDLRAGRQRTRIPVLREPIAAALSPDERVLAVANHLPEGPANDVAVSAAVTLVDTAARTVRRHVRLPSGSTALQGIAIPPSGRFAAVVHSLARFQVPTTQLEHGWMNVAALSLIDLEQGELALTVLLDEPRRGAANPWAVAFVADGAMLCVTHAGTHEVSLIDVKELEKRLSAVSGGPLVGDLDFLRGIRKRVPLAGNGPRALAASGRRVYVGEFFSDTVSVVDLDSKSPSGCIRLSSEGRITLEREGERLFHDATIAHQGWQSCASCHPDGRADGLNWDLLNDGIGNPKNTKSLLHSHRTPPAMSSGVRGTAEQAVRSGLRRILFAVPSEERASAIDAYLSSLKPAANPNLATRALSRAARRGKRLFEDPRAGCASCHPAPLFTDCKQYSLGGSTAQRGKPALLDTPTLVECWRTAPYLHDGSAATVREVLTTRNPGDHHGKTSHLSTREIDDLAAYVLSL